MVHWKNTALVHGICVPVILTCLMSFFLPGGDLFYRVEVARIASYISGYYVSCFKVDTNQLFLFNFHHFKKCFAESLTGQQGCVSCKASGRSVWMLCASGTSSPFDKPMGMHSRPRQVPALAELTVRGTTTFSPVPGNAHDISSE